MFPGVRSRSNRTIRVAIPLMVILCSIVGAIVINHISSKPAHAASSGFVYRCGIHFCLDGNYFYFAGTNTYDMFTYGDGSSTSDQNAIENNYMDKAKIDSHMAALEADGVSVLRLWAFSHESWHGFEPSKGVYNEAEFDEFDYIIQSAAAHNIKLLPVLENYWTAYGGIDAVLGWEGLSGGDSNRWQFFNQSKCPGCFTDYEDYVSHVLNHVNHYTGVAWKDDSTIFGWELMNEPRYQNATPNENTTGTTLRAWVDTMGAYIKNIDPNHMLDAGLEGHQSSYGFGGDEGNPFIYIQESPYIDFTSAHPYPTESWANLTIAQTQALIGQWISDSHNVIGKPFFMGEFNVSNVDRSSWWSAIYAEMETAGGDGDAFWWYETTNVDGTYGVLQGAPELAVFRQHSANMLAKDGVSGSPTPTSTNTPTATTTVTSTPTPTPTPPLTTVTDPLNDYTDVYAHSANLTFDNTNTQYFNGDTERLTRSASDAEWVVWQMAGMVQFEADTYFWPSQSGVNDFQFFASPDNSTYTQVSPQVNNLGGNWTHIQYTLSLPAGTSYVKMVFPTNATNVWDPQISQVIYSGSASGSGTPTPTPTPTNTPTNTPTPTPTSTPTPGGSCNIAYSATSWSGSNGFNGSITINNTGSTTINGWELVFTFPDGQTLDSGWNGTWTQQGEQVTVTNASWNATINAGSSISLGFNAYDNGTNPNPTSFTLNNQACSVV